MGQESFTNGTLAVVTAVASCLVVGNAQARQYVSTAWMAHSADLGVGRRVTTRPSSLTVYEIVRVMRDNGLPVSAIAEMARVERKTIYSWLDQTAVVRPQNDERIRSLFSVLKEATGGHYRQLRRVWNQKDADGRSLRDDLTAEVLDLAVVRERIKGLGPTIDRYVKFEAKRDARPPRQAGNPVLDSLPSVAVSS